MKFKARILIEHEILCEAHDVETAAALIRADVAKVPGASVLGIIPADDQWPDAESTKPRPPRNKPPSGSPGTPTLTAQPEITQVVAA